MRWFWLMLAVWLGGVEQPVSFRMAVVGVPTAAGKVGLRPAAVPTTVEVDAATTVVESFRFDLGAPFTCGAYADLLTEVVENWRVAACEPEEAGVSLRFQGPFVFDLTRETVTPDTSMLALPAATYTKVRLKLDANGPDGEDGVSMMVAGRLIDGGVEPFLLALDLEDELEYRAAAPVTVEQQRGAEIVVRLDLVSWLLGAGTAIADCRDELRAELGADAPLVFDTRQDGSAECDAVEDLLGQRLDGIGELEGNRDEAPSDDEGADG